MTEQTTTDTPPEPSADETAAAPETTEATDTAEDAGGETDTPNAEAAKYRHRAKAAEAERDTLAARVETMQRGEVERIAADHLKDGSELWLTGVELADLLGEDGNVDPAAVAERAQQVTTDRPHWRRPPEPKSPRSGSFSSGLGNGAISVRPSFQSAFAPRNRD